MNPCRPHFLIACLLIAVQAVVALLGPAGLVLCREADGSVHVELAAGGCCESAPMAGPERASSGGADSDTQALCEVAECRDVPLSQDQLAARSRQGRVLQGGGEVRGTVVVAVVTTGPATTGPKLARWMPASLAGPPRQVQHGLRATVLLL
jgi:hypothetical protein